MVKGTW